jgi:DNA-binding LacI/PurR family transcriptional regulator
MRHRASAKPATIEDVALAAGVSAAAVSRVFSKRAVVAPATTKRVTTAASRLGYTP